MSKEHQKKPSDKDETRLPVMESAESVATPAAPVPAGDTVAIVLTDHNQVAETEVRIPTREFGFRISHGGTLYEQCRETSTGVRVYAPVK